MVDKSWGIAGTPGFRVRTNLTLDERAAERARARETRTADRSEAIPERLKTQAAKREAEMQERERERQARREEEMRSAAADPHAAAAKRHRSSGRKDVVREQRDTRGYATLVDSERICEVAKRGASVAGLAAAFGVPAGEIEEILATAPKPA